MKSAWPEIKELLRSRAKLLAISSGLLIINRVASLVLPYSSKLLLDRVIAKRDLDFLLLLAIGVILATLIQSGTSYALVQLLSKEGQRIIAQLRIKVFSHIVHLPLGFFDSNKTGALISRIMTDVEGARNVVGAGLLEFAGGVLTAGIVLVLMIRTDFPMTVVAVISLVILTAVLSRIFKTIRPLFRERGRVAAEVTGRLGESLSGARVVKGYCAEQREEQVFKSGVERLLSRTMKIINLEGAMGLSSTFVMGCVGGIIMYMGARRVVAHYMTTGDLFQYILFLGYLSAPIFQIANIGTEITEAVAGLDRTREILSEYPEDEDTARVISLDVVDGEVVFRNVEFSYGSDKLILENISFVAKPDTVTALIGSSGSGKSTIIGLVAAFYKPNAGRVLVDGVDLSRVRLDTYRRSLGIVLQDSFLFDGTIRENVAFANPDASDEEIENACRVAHVDEFAQRFKENYATIVGERGVKLSGGQRQRISIARAVLANPKILILDEATSSLDSQSESFIRQGLSYLMKGRTTFVIAHRLSTVREADQILVVEAGRIVESGTHGQLYALKGRYFELYTTQYGIESDMLLDSEAEDQNIAQDI
jgi:ABC-type bacteriocin/lantibiotic exporter with double-glycine peptidase domain